MFENNAFDSIGEVRRFNRFYTKRIGLLTSGLLKTRFPLTQARIIFELAQHEQATARELIEELEIDPGYLSRILDNFEINGLINKVQSQADNRQWFLKLTSKGRKSFSELNERSNQEVQTLLKNMSDENQQRLINAMSTIEEILDAKQKSTTSYLLRSHRPGDIGWITHRHGVLYAEEYGFDETFEALVADILAKFIQRHNPKREHLWIAEQDGKLIGSVMIVDSGDSVAQLRLLLVEPKARCKGIGKRLIDECIDLSKRNGYSKIKLWTNNVLKDARRVYAKAGFALIEEKPHTSFGHDLIGEIWELNLRN